MGVTPARVGVNRKVIPLTPGFKRTLTDGSGTGTAPFQMRSLARFDLLGRYET